MSQSLIGLVARVELRLSKRNDFAAALFYLLCGLVFQPEGDARLCKVFCGDQIPNGNMV